MLWYCKYLELTAMLRRNFVHWVLSFIMSFHQYFETNLALRLSVCWAVNQALDSNTVLLRKHSALLNLISNSRYIQRNTSTKDLQTLCHFAMEKKLNFLYNMNKPFRKQFQSRFPEATSKGS